MSAEKAEDTFIAENSKVDKGQVKSILEKETLTYWDVKVLFEYIDTALKGKESNAGLNYFASVSTQIQEDVEWAIIKTKNIADTIVKLEESLLTQLNSSWERVEARYTDYCDKVFQLTQNAEKMYITLPDVRIPYGWTELLKMVDSLSSMSEEKQKAFYELVERFKKIEEQK